MKLSKNLKDNLKFLKKQLPSDDVQFLEITVGNKNAVLVFLKDVVDKDAIGELKLRPLAELKGEVEVEQLENAFLSPEKQTVQVKDMLVDEIVLGDTAFLIDGLDKAFAFGLKKFEKRAITEPPTQAVIKGPREGFVESLPVNVSLMRRRIKSPSLMFENLTIGRYSKTPVALCYIDGIADKGIVEKLKEKLKAIDIDAVLDSSYIAKFLGEHKTSVFKQVGNTEKPDILSAKILEGRIAVFVDGSPIALTVPYLLIEDFQSAGDYYSSSYSATVARLLRLMSVLVSIFLPAFFVSAELFHLQFIPLSFLLTIVNSIKGIPLSPSFEMFFTLLIFEILNEASVRMPRYVGMVVSIVGGLVLGETAVTAGIISAPTLMIVAFSGICLYTVPELEQVFSLIRMVLLAVGGSLGGYGLILSVCIMIIYLVSFENYRAPLLAPFSPLVKSDLKDGFYKGFLLEQKERPKSFPNSNYTRLKRKKQDGE
jgi:spore germination protein KA